LCRVTAGERHPDRNGRPADAASDAAVAGDEGLAAQPEKSRRPAVLAEPPLTDGFTLPGMAAEDIGVPGTLSTGYRRAWGPA
jgi:hypothetical protein